MHLQINIVGVAEAVSCSLTRSPHSWVPEWQWTQLTYIWWVFKLWLMTDKVIDVWLIWQAVECCVVYIALHVV